MPASEALGLQVAWDQNGWVKGAGPTVTGEAGVDGIAHVSGELMTNGLSKGPTFQGSLSGSVPAARLCAERELRREVLGDWSAPRTWVHIGGMRIQRLAALPLVVALCGCHEWRTRRTPTARPFSRRCRRCSTPCARATPRSYRRRLTAPGGSSAYRPRRNAVGRTHRAVAVRGVDRARARRRRVERANLRSRGEDRRQRGAGVGVLHVPSQRERSATAASTRSCS